LNIDPFDSAQGTKRGSERALSEVEGVNPEHAEGFILSMPKG